MEPNPTLSAGAEAENESWHKIVSVLMHKFDLGKVVITPADLERLAADYPCCLPTILASNDEEGIHLQLVSYEEGQRLAAEHGGLPS